jgi:branched-chain amino acid transport system substrate-binding protein
LLGTYSTTLVQAQSTAAEREGIPYVNGGGAATAIYARGYKWVFGALAPIQSLAGSEMEWIAEEQEKGNIPKPARIAVIWENTTHGEDYLKGIQDWADQSDGAFEVAMEDSFELDTKDYSAVLGKVENEDIDLFMADAHLPDFLTMHRQYVARKLCDAIVTYGARGSEKDAVDVVGQENVNYILSAVWWHSQLAETQPEQNEQFIELFEKEYGRTPEWYGALAYDTARALFTAIEEAGSVDREAVREALTNLEMDSLVPGGKLSFPAETGYQADYPFVVQQNLPDGTSPIIYPDDVATGKGVAPNPNCET